MKRNLLGNEESKSDSLKANGIEPDSLVFMSSKVSRSREDVRKSSIYHFEAAR